MVVALTSALLCAELEAAEQLQEPLDSVPCYSGQPQTLNPLLELEAGVQPHAPAPEPPQGVKEVGRQVKCAAFYLRCYCLYVGCGPSAC